jgi:phospholipid/cholesterol/gamma-HCH transport system substrate-binding protein
MKNENKQFIQTGFLVLSGTAFLLILLYMIGKNENLFSSGFLLRARFKNIQGLKEGNNVRYAGIDMGTVKNIRLLNDSIVEVDMRMSRKLKGVLLKNSIVSIGTDGLVGNKVINIAHGNYPSTIADNNDLLPSVKPVDTDKLLATLDQSNQELNLIFKNIRKITDSIQQSKGWKRWMNDTSIHSEISQSAIGLNKTVKALLESSRLVQTNMQKINNQDGLLGKLIGDTAWANQSESLIFGLNSTSAKLDQSIYVINEVMNDLKTDLEEGPGVLNLVMKDSMMRENLSETIERLNKSGKLLEENLKALQSSFLLRGYFKKKIRKNEQ